MKETTISEADSFSLMNLNEYFFIVFVENYTKTRFLTL